jgi:hypothetical protein
MTTWVMGFAIATSAFIVGVIGGMLLWQLHSSKSRESLPEKEKPATPIFWDIHSVLNTMNRFAVAAERGRSMNPTQIYNLSDYLLHSALLQREGGWSNCESLENWLLSHLRVLGELNGGTDLPALNIHWRDGVRRFHAGDIVRELIWCLQKIRNVKLIDIHLSAGSQTGDLVEIRIQVHGDREELDHMSIGDFASSSWSLLAGVCTCELLVRGDMRSPL